MSLPKGDTMKIVTCWSVFVLLALLAFPLTADAFSRRASHSEVGLTQVQPTHHHKNQSVPVPGTFLLVGGGFAAVVAWRHRSRRGKSVLPKAE
jgi:hypothetical protein